MFSYRLLGKAIVICFIVSVSVFLLGQLLYIYYPKLVEQYILYLGPEIVQTIILCICGYLLCRHEQKRSDLKPAVYQNVLLQFLSQYGLVLLLSGLLIITYAESKFVNTWPFSYLLWFMELNKPVLNPFALLSLLIGYAIQPGNLCIYWLMYVVYGLTKSFYQLKQK